jgi:hypothetical protein
MKTYYLEVSALLRLPIPESCTPLSTTTTRKDPNSAQPAARYPLNLASVSITGPDFDAAVTVEAMTAATANPTEFPIWATVLKTPPARLCFEGGKALETTILETV